MKTILALLACILVMGCNYHEERNKKHNIDPMKVSHGVATRLSVDGASLHQIDSTVKFGYSKIKLKFKSDVVVFNNYTSDTLTFNWSSKQGDLVAITIEVDSSNEFIEIPITNRTANGANVVITPDSTLLPGIFKVLIRGKDSTGQYTAAIEKYIVINSGKLDFNKLNGVWTFRKFTVFGANMKYNRFHHIAFDNGETDEWVDGDSIVKHNKSAVLGLMLSGIALSREQARLEDYKYLTNNDNIRFVQGSTKQAFYQVLTLTNDRMIIKENVGGQSRFAILMK